MNVSRREFVKTSALTASLPIFASLPADYCEAGMGDPVDLTMGYSAGAIRMNINENPLGPSAEAVAAAQSAMPVSNRYATGDVLLSMLAEHQAVDQDWVLVGNGSTEILRSAPLAFARDAGSTVVSARETWNVTPRYAETLGARTHYVKLLKDQDYAYDIDGMLNAVDSGTRIFFVVNPNNPTGSYLNYDELKRIADSLPKEVLFIIDEAYAQYNPGVKTGMDLVREGYRNVLVTRTFSKAYALAALRCGYAIAHPDIVQQVGQHGCDASTLNIAAYSAIQAALSDQAHLERSRELAREVTEFYTRQSEKLGLRVVTGPMPLPFILIEVGDRAKAIQQELQNRNIFVRHVESWGLPNHLRISCGLPADNQAFFRELKTLL